MRGKRIDEAVRATPQAGGGAEKLGEKTDEAGQKLGQKIEEAGEEMQDATH